MIWATIDRFDRFDTKIVDKLVEHLQTMDSHLFWRTERFNVEDDVEIHLQVPLIDEEEARKLYESLDLGTVVGFVLKEDDEDVIQTIKRIIRRLLQHPRITARQVIGLGNGLYALERLPQTTKGASCRFSIWYREDKFSDLVYMDFEISEDIIEISHGGSTYYAGVGSDSYSLARWLVQAGGYAYQTDPMYNLEEIVTGLLHSGAKLSVEDESFINYEGGDDIDEEEEEEDEEDEDDLQDELNMDEEMIELHFSDDAIHEIAISKNGRFVAYQSIFDDEINVIDVEKRKFLKKLSIIDAVNDMFFLENALELIISFQNGKIVVCDWVEDTEELLFDLDDTVYSMDVTPDYKVALVGGYTTLYVLDLNAREIIKTMELDPEGGSIIDSVSISSDGTLGISGSPHGPVHLWNLVNGINIYSDKICNNSSHVQLSPVADFVLFKTDDGLYHINRIKEDTFIASFLDYVQEKRVISIGIDRRLALHDCNEMLFLPDNELKVLVFCKGGKVVVYDIYDCNLLELSGDYFGTSYSDLPTSCYSKISGNGEFVVLGEQDGTVRLARLPNEI